VTGKRIRRLLVGLVATSTLALAAAPGAGLASGAPEWASGWLGLWHTNFGELWFTSVTYSDAMINDDGTETSSCANHGPCTFHWLLRGIWRWPGSKGHVNLKTGKVDTPPFPARWVTIKGFPTADKNGASSIEPCWEGPRAVFYGKGYAGDQCNFMLLYRSGNKEKGGGWKTCPLEGSGPNCGDHHYLSGKRVFAGTGGEGHLWEAGFRFLQTGIPDGGSLVSTQTGGAGTLIFTHQPGGRSTGQAAEGSGVFHIENFGQDTQIHLTISLENGRLDVREGETVLQFQGAVTDSEDDRCPVGSHVNFGLQHRHNPGNADRIILKGNPFAQPSCDLNEIWTSTDRRRVSITIDPVKRLP
jgi:hypothetical protein